VYQEGEARTTGKISVFYGYAYTNLVWEPVGKRPLEIPRRKWEETCKTNLREKESEINWPRNLSNDAPWY
jgi:hypothetical protein